MVKKKNSIMLFGEIVLSFKAMLSLTEEGNTNCINLFCWLDLCN